MNDEIKLSKSEIIGICEFLKIHHFENSYLLLDYITNLQNKYENQIHRYMNLKEQTTNLQEKNEDLKDRLKVMEHFKNSLLEENEDYKSRYEKATELIEKSRVKATPFFKQFDGDLLMPKREVDKLLNILNVSDKEN